MSLPYPTSAILYNSHSTEQPAHPPHAAQSNGTQESSFATGFSSKKTESYFDGKGKGQHPVEKLQLNLQMNRLKAEESRDVAIFGGHVAMRNTMERNILGQHQRLPGLVSNMTSLESLLDLDETLEFEDFLNPHVLNVEKPLGGKVGPGVATFKDGFEESMCEIEERKIGKWEL